MRSATKDKVSKSVTALYRILPRPGSKVIIFLTGDSLCSGEATQAHTMLCYSFSGISLSHGSSSELEQSSIASTY